MEEILISLRKINKIYGEGSNSFYALKDLNLDINKGEFVAIMGASGSGKSTLMNILGALDRPTSGEYLIHGKDISKMKDSELADFRNSQVGFVFQQFNLLNKTNVYDNVALPALYGHVEDVDKRIMEVLDIVNLRSKIKNKPNQLSGGQMQRVAIARALLMSPSIIMADEPTGNLDSTTAYEIMDTIAKLHDDGNTIILVTHEVDIAEYADRIITLKDGNIIDDKMNRIKKIGGKKV